MTRSESTEAISPLHMYYEGDSLNVYVPKDKSHQGLTRTNYKYHNYSNLANPAIDLFTCFALFLATLSRLVEAPTFFGDNAAKRFSTYFGNFKKMPRHMTALSDQCGCDPENTSMFLKLHICF